jgi:hypothetical protein
MQKQNWSHIETGRGQKRKAGYIGVPKDRWDIAQDLFICSILSKDPNPVDIDKLSEESYKDVHKILSMAIKEFDVSTAAIHTVCIHRFQGLFSSTDNHARKSPISCPSVLH